MRKKTYDRLLGRNLIHGHDPLFLVSPDGSEWAITVADGGSLVITGQPSILGSPIGLLLSLTYATV